MFLMTKLFLPNTHQVKVIVFTHVVQRIFIWITNKGSFQGGKPIAVFNYFPFCQW